MTEDKNLNDPIIQKVKENLNLTQKQAEHFADQARALQRNLQLRKKQKEEWAQEKANEKGE